MPGIGDLNNDGVVGVRDIGLFGQAMKIGEVTPGLTSGQEQLVSDADCNGDGRVDGEDLVLVGLCFGTSSGDPRYSNSCDLNNDGKVNNADLSILENNFGNSGG